MTAPTATARETMASSQWSPGGSQSSDASCNATTTGRTTPTQPTERPQDNIIMKIEIIAAYLVKERAPDAVQAALGYVRDAYDRRVKPGSTEQALRQLQTVVQKLADKVENKSYELPKGSYAAAVAQGSRATYSQARAQQSLNPEHVTLQKPVPLRHKREIVIVRGNETAEQKRRTYKELLEQMNKAGIAGEAVAVRKLQTGDMMMTMEDEQARMSWLSDTKWLETFGEGARVKRREFVVMAYRI
jgi:hypothetical protein